MRKPIQQILTAIFLTCFFSVASLAAIDLAGSWNVEGDEDITLVFLKTPFQTNLGGDLYSASGNVEGLWGASIENIDGVDHLVWWGIAGDSFDAESNIILEATETSISLGGDFETYEVVRLTKITGGDEGDIDDGGCVEGGGGQDPEDDGIPQD